MNAAGLLLGLLIGRATRGIGGTRDYDLPEPMPQPRGPKFELAPGALLILAAVLMLRFLWFLITGA